MIENNPKKEQNMWQNIDTVAIMFAGDRVGLGQVGSRGFAYDNNFSNWNSGADESHFFYMNNCIIPRVE